MMPECRGRPARPVHVLAATGAVGTGFASKGVISAGPVINFRPLSSHRAAGMSENFTRAVQRMMENAETIDTDRVHQEIALMAGDYNVIPQAEDVHNPDQWTDDALYLPQTRAAWRRLLALGYTEAFRALNTAPLNYTFWDYQAGAWRKNNGIRIDHLLLMLTRSRKVKVTIMTGLFTKWDM